MSWAIPVAALTFFSTCTGGFFAIRTRDRLHLLLGFSSGAVLGVVFFDIFPELVNRARAGSLPISNLMVVLAAGFFSFFFLERLTRLHAAREHEHREGEEEHGSELGVVGAAGLSFHSFLDGLAIAVGFKGSQSLGILISVAVLTHDFSDGLNTVTVMLAHGNPLRRSVKWLLTDATTPMLGAISGLILPLPSTVLPYILAFFAGFFLYIAASDLLPEAREHESPLVAVASVTGITLLFLVTRAI